MLNRAKFTIFNSFIDFFLPRFCLGCAKKLNPDIVIICDDCKLQLPKVQSSFLKSEYEKKFQNEKIIEQLHTLYLFKEGSIIQDLMHELKYNNKFLIGKYLGKEIGNSFKKEFSNNKLDLIIPMPLHKLKKSERGFNQSLFIAKGISSVINVPYSANLVRRKKYTQSQTKLSLNERRENIRGAFRINGSKDLKGKNILIVDDVVTTGASISELGKVLKGKGAKEIHACTVALAG